MKIKVKWDIKPQTGETTIESIDLGCRTKRMWDNLKQDEQRKRIDEYLSKYKPMVELNAWDW